MDATPDPFEMALRGVLGEQAGRSVPTHDLHAMLDAVIVGGRSRGASGIARWARVAATLAASIVVIAAVGLLLGRSGGSMWSVGGDDDDGPAITWDSGAARLEADSFRIEALGTFTGTPDVVNGAPAIAIDSDPGSATYRTLEVEWQEQGLPMRLSVYLAADDTHWWVTEMRTYDGSSRGAWIHYPGPLFRTPLGDSYVGDFAAVGQRGDVPGSLRIDGMRLTAFAPGTGPAPRTGCQPWRIVPGGPADTLEDLVGLTSAQAAARLRARGTCFEFRWSYRTGPGSGFSETWCVPPPTGFVDDADTLDDGTVLLWVEDDTGVVREVRDQPPAGWGCPTDQRGAASPGPADVPTPAVLPPVASATADPSGGPASVSVEAEVAASPVP